MINIIPATDIIGGKCVRLTEGDYGRCSVYDADPLDMAKTFEDCGVSLLHLVDLEGAKSSSSVNLKVLEKIASGTSLKVEFGGGIKSDAALKSAFDAGAYRIVAGSVACSEPELFSSWLQRFGGERIVLGADVRNGKVAVNGWLDSAPLAPDALIGKFLPDGLKTVIVTDISKDGMLAGPSVGLYAGLMQTFPGVEIVASGGVSSMLDIAALDRSGVPAVIVGKAIYEGRITPEDIRRHAAQDKE